MLERNLQALGPRSIHAAARIRAAASPDSICFERAADGSLCGSVVDASGITRQLASRRAPLDEARRLVASLDLTAHAGFVITGFGLGAHVELLVRRLGRLGAAIVFEPDVGLLRAVMERVDFSPIFAGGLISLVVDPDDRGAIAAAVEGLEGLLCAGTKFVTHPPSAARLGPQAGLFQERFASVLKAVRTNVLTTLVQSEATLRNLLQNADRYVLSPGVDDLQAIARGKPAVVVSAGPSLARNLDLLAQPGVRDRVVIIAVQTVLKTLLSRGIRPHYVTAIDYHEISRRFYEGLTREGVEGVELVVDPKCNPAIPQAFPGRLRCTSDELLDRALGESLARPRGSLPPSATVAHLAYSLARHLGCDPVILVGQDLAFTDGQYYAPGAAIHNVWSGELSEFNSLELLEWQRIARMRGLLRPVPSQSGGTIYTDEQMSTYLVQFERMFALDASRGLRVIDATEGGALKRHTTPMPLARALDAFALPQPSPLPPAPADRETRDLARLESRLRTLRREVGSIAHNSEKALASLRQMLALGDDEAAIDRLIVSVDALAKETMRLQDAFFLVQFVNQVGQLNRFRADRAIKLAEGLTPKERQRREIERDITGVTWVRDAARQVGSMIDDALRTLAGAERLTRDPTLSETDERSLSPEGSVSASAAPRVHAIIPVDLRRGGLNTPRTLAAPIASSSSLLAATLTRLARVEGLDGVVLLTDDPDALRPLLEGVPASLPVRIERDTLGAFRARRDAVARARLWSAHAWRGGIASLSAADEAFCPSTFARVMDSLSIDAALILCPDWSHLDPALASGIVRRHGERPASYSLTFSQAAPGLAPFLASRRVVNELAGNPGPLCSLGALLAYLPMAPQADPIAKPICIPCDITQRDVLSRCIPDSPARLAWLNTLAPETIHPPHAAAPRLLTLDLRGITDEAAGLARIRHAAQPLFANAPDLAITLLSDPATPLPVLASWAAAAGECAAGVHLRLRLDRDESQRPSLEALSRLVSVISADFPGASLRTFPPDALGGGADAARSTVAWLLDLVAGNPDTGGLPRCWIVPRLLKRDDTLAEVEEFVDRGIMATGSVCLDGDTHAPPDARLRALPLPASTRARLARESITITPEGEALDGEGTRLSPTLDALPAALECRAARRGSLGEAFAALAPALVTPLASGSASPAPESAS